MQKTRYIPMLLTLGLTGVLCWVAATSRAAVTDSPTLDNDTVMESNANETVSANFDIQPEIPEFDGGHIAWMLVCCALVLMMTAPGLALFYGGLVRRKNILSVMMQCISLMGLMSVLWALVGYSLCFGGTNPYWGNLDHVMLKGVVPHRTADEQATAEAGLEILKAASGDRQSEIQDLEKKIANLKARVNTQADDIFVPGEGNKIPTMVFALFQGMFFIITPALICGAFAERFKFSTMCVFSVLWGLLVYCPICHWVWSDHGWLCEWNESATFGALDFAGGTVVHISSGVAALVCALYVGKRHGYERTAMPPHNLTYTVVGTALLWVGWFGFNAGSALEPNVAAVNAFLATHLAAAAGVLAWSAYEWLNQGKPTVLGACSGAVAGLVCITPACGSVSAMSAILLGLIAGFVCCWACSYLKKRCGYDDSLDAFGVHGIGGAAGALLTGVFATKLITGAEGRQGIIESGGQWGQFINQLVSVGAAAAWSAVVALAILVVLRYTMGLRVETEDEQRGLDLTQHGEDGYIFSNL